MTYWSLFLESDGIEECSNAWAKMSTLSDWRKSNCLRNSHSSNVSVTWASISTLFDWRLSNSLSISLASNVFVADIFIAVFKSLVMIGLIGVRLCSRDKISAGGGLGEVKGCCNTAAGGLDEAGFKIIKWYTWGEFSRLCDLPSHQAVQLGQKWKAILVKKIFLQPHSFCWQY